MKIGPGGLIVVVIAAITTLLLWLDTPVAGQVVIGLVWVTSLVVVVIEHRRSNLASKATQQRDAFFDLSLDLLVIANFEGYLLQVNPAWLSMGWSLEELRAHPAPYFIHPDDLESTANEMRRIRSGSYEVRSFEDRRRCKDGSYRWLRWSALSDPQPKNPGEGLIFAVAHDITELKATLAELEERNAELVATNESLSRLIHATREITTGDKSLRLRSQPRSELIEDASNALVALARISIQTEQRNTALSKANEALESFTSVAAHQMRSPPRTIIGLVQVLIEDYGQALGEEGVSLARRIARNATVMTDVVSALQTMGQIQGTGLKLHPARLSSLLLLAEKTASTFRPGTLHVSNCDYMVKVSDTLMVEAFWNLIENSWKFNRSPTPTLWVTAEEIGPMIVVTFQDNGIGLSPTTPRLFEIFRRHTDEFPGTGVGMALVKQIIEKMGGSIEVLECDSGAMFRLKLQSYTENIPPILSD